MTESLQHRTWLGPPWVALPMPSRLLLNSLQERSGISWLSATKFSTVAPRNCGHGFWNISTGMDKTQFFKCVAIKLFLLFRIWVVTLLRTFVVCLSLASCKKSLQNKVDPLPVKRFRWFHHHSKIVVQIPWRAQNGWGKIYEDRENRGKYDKPITSGYIKTRPQKRRGFQKPHHDLAVFVGVNHFPICEIKIK